MTISRFNNEVRGWRDELLRPLYYALRKVTRRGARRDFRPLDFDLWENDPELHRVLLAVRMAANPGEKYEAVAARIDREADSFREFIRAPTPIGKIILNAKHISPHAGEGGMAGRVYQVRDPAEGQASVFYTFQRSDDLVLEFFVVDKNDKPLFPIVRTYSNWSGHRTFNLGLGRTFSLRMSEDDSPSLVRVEAGFNIADEVACDAAGLDMGLRGLPIAGRAGGDYSSGFPRFFKGFTWPSGRQFAFLVALKCLAVVLLCGLVNWRATASESLTGSPMTPVLALASCLYQPEASGMRQTVGNNSFLLAGLEDPSTVAQGDAFNVYAASMLERQAKNNLRSRARRGALPKGSIEIDDEFCRYAGSQCHELLAKIRSAADNMLGFLTPSAPSPIRLNVGRNFNALPVSDKRSATPSNHMHVTIFTENGLIVIKEPECSEQDENDEENLEGTAQTAFPGYATGNIWGIGELLDSQTRKNNTGIAERGVKAAQTE